MAQFDPILSEINFNTALSEPMKEFLRWLIEFESVERFNFRSEIEGKVTEIILRVDKKE